MKVALVASSFLPQPGRLERRVDQIARGLARRGVEVEILTQGCGRAGFQQHQGVIVRRFPTAVGPLRFAVAPKLRERLRLTSETFDVVDVHTRHVPLAVAVARTRARRIVFTPGAPLDVFLGWPYTRATRAVMASTAQIVCRSEIERDLLCETVPEAASRSRIVPDAVDVAAMDAATPFVTAGTVVLAVDRLDRLTGVRRAIASMLSLDPEFRLVVVGDGPARDRLEAYAADLRIASRVQFVGAVSDAVLYRWLRTARVVVTLAAERGSGSQVTEARAAGASVVASDLPIHREAAERPGGGHVIFVPAKGSPLDVADAIDEAARVSVLPSTRGLSLAVPSWEPVIDATWRLYTELIGDGLLPVPDPVVSDVAGFAAHRVNGWRT
ncbi:MAG: glycosyltransferase family 4 protein [Solirubrobacterales bacterium]|nr:glycosyltransferase family 4 protein [Solirubrobacterales bacterium]